MNSTVYMDYFIIAASITGYTVLMTIPAMFGCKSGICRYVEYLRDYT